MSIYRRDVSPRLRFAVIHRDNYTCQYCGAAAPDVQLEVDHLVPLSQGGTNEPENLITACLQCNRGKSDYALEEDGTLKANPKRENARLGRLKNESGYPVAYKLTFYTQEGEETGYIHEELFGPNDYEQVLIRLEAEASEMLRHLIYLRESLLHRYNLSTTFPAFFFYPHLRKLEGLSSKGRPLHAWHEEQREIRHRDSHLERGTKFCLRLRLQPDSGRWHWQRCDTQQYSQGFVDKQGAMEARDSRLIRWGI